MILVISPKTVYFVKRLIQEPSSQNIKYKISDIQDLLKCNFQVDISSFTALYIRYPYLHGSPKYLPRIIKLAKQFKKAGKRVVDANVVTGDIAKGKWVDYQKLKKANIRIPNTKLLNRKTIPKQWPFILKWIYGFKAKQVYLIDNQIKFENVYNLYPKGELLVQELLHAEYEYKVITVGYKALPVILRFRILGLGFRVDFEKYQVLKISKVPEVASLAERASKALGRELSKVDILEMNGQLYVLEVNRFPGLDSFEKLTNYNVVRAFLHYLQS